MQVARHFHADGAFFLHADMPQQTRTELIVGLAVDPAGVRIGRLQQGIEPPVVLRKKIGDHTAGRDLCHLASL